METNTTSYIKTDENKVINEKCIRWVKQMDECLFVCTKSTGCNDFVSRHRDSHKVCKSNNPESYAKLIKLFD
jgi:hypothetical protein